MRKVLLTLALVVGFAVSALAASPQLTLTDFEIDSSGQMKYKARVESATTSDTITAVETGKTFLVDPATTTVTFTLPTAASGLVYTFTAEDARASVSGSTGLQKIILDPASTDKFVGCVLSSSTSTFAADDRLISPGTTGDTVTIVGSSTKWTCTNRIGTWVDYN